MQNPKNFAQVSTAMSKIGDWSDHDNKKYTGKLDRIYVSMTEYYEVEYFIDTYLSSRNFVLSNSNRDIIKNSLEKFSGNSPFNRDELNSYLDGLYKK